ncbi:MAG TPA: AAA domain-containing protein [Ktedonobacterales bacterium]|nr:AAA domain-containing protein [Ktedonobacterales bacterium]
MMAEVIGLSSAPGCFLCQFDTRPCTVGMVEGALVAVHQQRPNGRWQRRLWLRATDGTQMTLWLGEDFGPLVETLAALPKATLSTLTLRAYHLDMVEGADAAYRATPVSILTLEPDMLLSITDLNHVDFCRRQYAIRQLVPSAPSAATLRGSLIHTSFKELLKAVPPPEQVETAIAQHLTRALEASLQDLALCEMGLEEMQAEAQPHLESLGNWYRQQRQSLWGSAPQIRAETFLLAPEVGLKGRIDLFWEDADTRLLLELKTGAAHGELPKRDHRWQVYGYYTLLAARRAQAPGEGAQRARHAQPAQATVLYSATPRQAEAYRIPFSLRDLRRVVEARNLLALIRATQVVPPPPGVSRCAKCMLRATCAEVSPLLGWQPPADEDAQPPADAREHTAALSEARSSSGQRSEHEQRFAEWFARYLRLLHLEGREAEALQSQLWRLSRQERVALGIAIDGLQLLEAPRQTASEEWEYRFTCENASEIREGDEILLSDGDPVRGAVVSGSVLQIGPDHVTVWTPEQIAYPALIDRYGTDIVHRRTTQNLYRWLHAEPRLRALVSSEQAPGFAHRPGDELQLPHLNAEQQEAVRRAARMQDYLLIQGPPGTGKTKVISEIVRLLVARGERVLLAAFTNQAVDNLLKRLLEDGFDQFVRLGHDFSVDPAIRPYRLVARARQHALSPAEVRALLKEMPVVASTTATWSSESYDIAGAALDFDVAIVDEAGQLTVPAVLGALRLARRFVLVGDQQQLAPLVMSKRAAEEGLSTSLFAFLSQHAGGEASISLVRQYRMHTTISTFPGREFYAGLLQADSSVATRVLRLPNVNWQAPLQRQDHQAGDRVLSLAATKQAGRTLAQAVLAPERPMVFLDVSQRQKLQNAQALLQAQGAVSPKLSLVEAEVVSETLELLLTAGIPPQAIGVIAPFRAQVAAIRHHVLRLAERFGDGLVVDTVDRFQGGERMVIVLSFAISKALPPESQIAAFLADEHRLNVALTRAQRKLILVGNRRALAPLPIYRRLLNYCAQLYPGGVVEV